MNQPLVSAIVLNYRSPRDTHQCVDALLKQTIAAQLEILVVDNHSSDESIGWLRARWNNHPQVKIIETAENFGYSRGNNTGLRHASGTYILIINPDNTLPPDALERMINVLKTEPDAGIVGPALMYADGSLRPSARGFPTIGDLFFKRIFPARWHANNAKLMNQKRAGIHQVDWLVGACLLIRRDLLNELGGFDDRFFLFFEDIDLCRRCAKHGKKVLYAPDIRVFDRKQRLSGNSILSLFTRSTTWIHAGSAMKYFWKWRNTYN